MERRFNTVYKKIIISYVVVVMLSVIMVAIISHNYASGMLKEEMINSGSEVTSRIGETLNRRVFKRAEEIWVQCAVRENQIGKALYNSSDLTQYDYYKISARLVEIASENSDVISSVDVYLGKPQVFLSSRGSGRVKFIKNSPEAIPERLRGIVERGEVSGGWLAAAPDDDMEETGFSTNSIITFYRTIPYLAESSIPFRGYVSVNVKADALADILKVEQGEKVSFAVTDKNGATLFHTGETLPDTAAVEEMLRFRETRYYTDVNGYIMNAAKLASEDLYVIRMVSKSVFFNRLKNMRIVVWMLCIIFAVFGLGISVFYARQIYNPIKRIVSNIHKFMEVESDKCLNEYSFIDSAINQLSNQVSSLESEVMQNREAVRIKNIVALLNGNELKTSAIDFQYNIFQTAVISLVSYIDNCEDIRRDVIGMLENGPDTIDLYFAVLYEDRIGIIANFQNKTTESELKQLMEHITLTVGERCTAVAALGAVCGKDDIAASFTDAVHTLQYKFFTEDNVLCANDYLYRELAENQFGNQLTKQFAVELKRGNEKEVLAIVDKLIDEIVESNCSYRHCKNRIHFIFSIYFNYILEENMNPDYAITENTYSELNRCSTIFEFKEWFENEIGEFLLKASAKPHVKASDMMRVAKQIIEENLDKDLSLNFVADRLYIAPAYLSRVFKSETGETFNTYITDRRLELARRLVIETNYSVNVITSKTGFNSATYLIKKFKKKYGQTPVNYKKNYIIKSAGQGGSEDGVSY